MVLIALILPIIGAATQVNEKLGPYSINFSTPTDIYTTQEITNNETYEGTKFQMYTLNILNKTAKNHIMGSITVMHFDNPVNTNGVQLSNLQNMHLFKTIDTYKRKIDNMPGELYIGKVYDTFNMYTWEYSLNSQNIVSGTSFMPWNNDTSEILDTLHVDVIKGTDEALHKAGVSLNLSGLSSNLAR